MTLIDAFTIGRLPAVGIFSIALLERDGRFSGAFYIDPQADQPIMTRQ